MKKLIVGVLALVMSVNAEATDLCKNLTGTWIGTYNDPSRLFPAGNFPISLQLQYQQGKVYGYTLPANDSKAGSFGSNEGAYFFIATCKNNTLSQIYFVKNQQQICGDPTPKATKIMLTQKSIINELILPYENAMINANLHANLTQQAEASTMNSNLLSQVQTLEHNGTIQTCH